MSTEYKHGEIKCQSTLKNGNNCKNGAYYRCKSGYFCGTHSRLLEREELQKFNKEEKKSLKDQKLVKMLSSAEKVSQINKKENRSGNVMLHRMSGRFAKVIALEGYVDIYPNYMSTYQGIGIVMDKLSPMSIGPIVHNQKGVPEAMNLENFHQFSKYYSQHETIEEFKKRQISGFNDKVPHRHKFDGVKTAPDYFVWIDKDQKEHHLGYLECRQFYSNYYMRAIEQLEDFKKLMEMLSNGYNIRICGPDAYDLKSDIMESYQDTSVPRGHEFILYTMLTTKKEEYPWIKMKSFDF